MIITPMEIFERNLLSPYHNELCGKELNDLYNWALEVLSDFNISDGYAKDMAIVNLIRTKYDNPDAERDDEEMLSHVWTVLCRDHLFGGEYLEHELKAGWPYHR